MNEGIDLHFLYSSGFCTVVEYLYNYIELYCPHLEAIIHIEDAPPFI